MPAQKYSVNHYPIQTLLTWVKSDEIAIPEIQRPFVWDAVNVRDLLDSLYRGYPIGYLIAWRNPTVKLKDGSSSGGKRVLIDGQQRMAALMTAILAREVVNKDYETVRIRIAFNPLEAKFEVANPAIQKDSAWIPDIATVFAPSFSMLEAVDDFCVKNPSANKNSVFKTLEALQSILNNLVGLIELNADLSIEEVTQIFYRVNKMGMELSEADFAMSKIASNETHGGNVLRKAIDYFCHLAVEPDFFAKIQKNDPEFADTEFLPKMAWLKNENDDIYDPSYTDMLRVAFTSEFHRGRLQDLVALLSGRNFETKQFEDAIAEDSFRALRRGILNYINETHFKRFVMIVRSAGFVDPSLIGSKNVLNFAYILYLTLRTKDIQPHEIEHAVRRWFVMSMLTGRYSGSIETAFDNDIRKMHDLGFEAYMRAVEQAELSPAFWSNLLPQELNTSAAASPYFRVFQAAQVKMKDKGFLSRDITVQDLIMNKSDVHHLFPRKYLKTFGMQKGRYNQIANFAMTQSEINIAIGDRPPCEYFRLLWHQTHGGKIYFGGITDPDELADNFKMHCLPDGMETMTADNYDAFLEERRNLMASKLKRYYDSL